MVKTILGDTTIRFLIEAHTDQVVGMHCRIMELIYNKTVAFHNQAVLYIALIRPAGLNVLYTVRKIFFKFPHAVQVEVNCSFLYSVYSKWKSGRNKAGQLSDIEIRYVKENVSDELAEARMDLDTACNPVMSSTLHRYNFTCLTPEYTTALITHYLRI